MEKGKERYPLLVTTADNVLLDHSIIDSFLDGVDDADLAVAMVERRVLLSRYPQSRRTWLKFRQGWWSGANIFWLANDNVKPLLNLWRGVEQDRKKGMKIVDRKSVEKGKSVTDRVELGGSRVSKYKTTRNQT